MAELGRKTKRYPSDLADEEWTRIEPPLPKLSRCGRRPAVDLREVLNATCYMARSVGGWRMLPVHFGSYPRQGAGGLARGAHRTPPDDGRGRRAGEQASPNEWLMKSLQFFRI